jgi:hypothetical protein
VPWQEFFDLKALKSAKVPLLEFHEYTEIVGGPHVDIAVSGTDTRIPREQRYGNKGSFYGWAKQRDSCTDLVEHTWNRAQKQWQVAYAGDCDGGILAQEYRCAVFAQWATRDIVDMALSLSSNVTSVLLKKCDSVSPPTSEDMDKLELRESMLFADSIRLAGDEFITTWLGGSRYLAVHCRRTDFLTARKDTTPGPRAIATQINAMLRENSISHVFVATDAPSDLRDSLKKQVDGVVHFFDEAADIWSRFQHPGKRAAVEMWIAARADAFLGTQNSRFTMHIQLERSWLGKPVESSSRELCKTAKASNDRSISTTQDSSVLQCFAPDYRHSERRGARHSAYWDT